MAVLMQVYFLVTILLFHRSSSLELRDSDAFCNNDNLSIIGGNKITIEDAPFIVALYKYSPKKFRYETLGCGGSIVHERFVLTAAHCFIWAKDKLRVLVGSDRLTTGGDYIDVEEKFCHQGFSLKNLMHDICLLKLADPVPFGCKVAQIGLPHKDLELEKGELVNVTGWGIIDINATALSNDLRQVTVPIVSQECCAKYYKRLNETEICAGSRGHDSCKGDSGGPLTYNGILVGIVSYGYYCNIYPGVYTRVASYLDWIQNIIDDNL